MQMFYVYGYKRDKESEHGPVGSYYYIGKGQGNRAWKKRKGEVKPPTNKKNVEIICQDMSEEDAFQLEISLIATYGRINLETGSLHNRTDGGEGTSGAVLSDETKAAQSLAMMGKKHTPEQNAAQSLAMKKTWEDPEQKATRSIRMKEAWDDPELRAKQSAALKKTWEDPEQKATRSIKMKQIWEDPELRAKMSCTMKQIWASRRNSETFSLFC